MLNNSQRDDLFSVSDNLFLASNDKLVKLVMTNSDFACTCSIVGFILQSGIVGYFSYPPMRSVVMQCLAVLPHT
jgi:hypothetical protein